MSISLETLALAKQYTNENSVSVTPEQIQTAVDNYLTENPVESGATSEQAEQIEKNKNDIDIINKKLIWDETDDNKADIKFKRKTKIEIDSTPVEDGSILFSTDTSEIFMDNGTERKVYMEGSGGTSNYQDLTNKPQINGIELSGNKTADDFKLLNKNQGSDNSGKILGIQPDGNIQPENAFTFEYDELANELNLTTGKNSDNDNIDDTLTQSGQAADAKVTGDKISSLSEDIDNIKNGFLFIEKINAADFPKIDRLGYEPTPKMIIYSIDYPDLLADRKVILYYPIPKNARKLKYSILSNSSEESNGFIYFTRGKDRFRDDFVSHIYGERGLNKNLVDIPEDANYISVSCVQQIDGYDISSCYIQFIGYESIVKPEMFGAKGDGETDDTVAIQNALDYAVSKKMSLHFSSKKYITTKPIVIKNSYVHMEGDGFENTIIENTVSDMFEILQDQGNSEYNRGLYISKIKFDGVNQDYNFIKNESVYLNWGNIKECFIYGFNAFCNQIYFTGFYIENCYINKIRTLGIWSGSDNYFGRIMTSSEESIGERKEFLLEIKSMNMSVFDTVYFTGGLSDGDGAYSCIGISITEAISFIGCVFDYFDESAIVDSWDTKSLTIDKCIIRGCGRKPESEGCIIFNGNYSNNNRVINCTFRKKDKDTSSEKPLTVKTFKIGNTVSNTIIMNNYYDNEVTLAFLDESNSLLLFEPQSNEFIITDAVKNAFK